MHQLGNRTWRVMVGLAAMAVLAAACGDDDDDAADATTTTEAEEETTTTAAPDGVNPEFADYCAAVAAVDTGEELPTAEQIEAIRAVAPDEISAEIDVVADAFIVAIEAGDPELVFDDPTVAEAFGPIEAFEDENCGTGGDEDAGGEVNPEFADYCALAIELDEQPSFPTAEQLDAILAAAPDEIRAEAEIVVAGFLEAQAAGSPEAAFDDPEVVSNLSVIEDFEEENCGIVHTDG